MEHIVLSTRLSGDGTLEVHGLADISIVRGAIFAGGVLLHFLDVGGRGVLFLDGHGRIGGVQGANRAQRGIHQVVAQVQTDKLHFRRISLLGALIGDVMVGSVLLCQLGKGSDISVFSPGHIALRVHAHIRALDGIAVDKGIPSSSSLVSVGAGILVVALQVQNLIDGVGLAHNRVINGDAAGFLRGEGGGDQAQGHDQCQQDAGDSLCAFHVSDPFFFFHLLLNFRFSGK